MEKYELTEKQKTLTKEYLEKHQDWVNEHKYTNLFGNAIRLVMPAIVYIFELSGINIYHYIDYIPAYAYMGRIDIVDEYIPPHIKSIDYGSFSDCKSLKEVHIPTSVELIEAQAFTGIKDLTIRFNGGRDEFDKITIEKNAFETGTKIVCYDNAFLYGL